MKIFGIALLLLLSACAGMPHSSMEHAQITSEEVFIAEMIPHHQEAVDSSRLMLNTQNEQVRSLAQRIITAQEEEIAMMNQWMDAWYPQSTYEHTYQPMMGDMLNASDRAYLEGMIQHHEAAIQMARQARTVELRTETRQLADNIIKTQQSEIDEMRMLIDSLQ